MAMSEEGEDDDNQRTRRECAGVCCFCSKPLNTNENEKRKLIALSGSRVPARGPQSCRRFAFTFRERTTSHKHFRKAAAFPCSLLYLEEGCCSGAEKRTRDATTHSFCVLDREFLDGQQQEDPQFVIKKGLSKRHVVCFSCRAVL